jgi:hypothetical protein
MRKVILGGANGRSGARPGFETRRRSGPMQTLGEIFSNFSRRTKRRSDQDSRFSRQSDLDGLFKTHL